ncbi:hypothetical protein HNP37_003966 [Flavobacterium nitrogenifigens]|uniref:Uncharacterized protein n=2 Tax=Flavobacterium TaxID=237 RepID=A0A7W7J0A4_9FLAO|nr:MULTISPECIES: hypothetical protein [Flavobacterium]MBB4803886.1 hypothetical protein [Flavobacterium nitrogenifigens]MBB6388962.1 hypothetical protein [Flavobacterium notoginsengisoli]
MRLVVCLLLFFIPTLNYGFKKNVMPYSIVISKAVLIVDGTISKVSKDEYQFKIDEFVKGKSNPKINVTIWKEWICDPRIKELKTGQRLILFLEKSPNGNYYPINYSTGELYVDNNAFIDIFLPKDFSNPEALKQGIRMFLEIYKCFGDLNNRFYANIYFVRNKSIFEIYEMKMTNSSFGYLVDNADYFKVIEFLQFQFFKNYSVNSNTANSAG